MTHSKLFALQEYSPGHAPNLNLHLHLNTDLKKNE